MLKKYDYRQNLKNDLYWQWINRQYIMHSVNLRIGVGSDWFSKMCDSYTCLVFLVPKVFSPLNVILNHYPTACTKE